MALKPHHQESTSRRSPRLADSFKKLPDELISSIFLKLQDDPKALIRCSSVCKDWASLVSELETLSLRYFLTVGEDNDDSPPCLQSHYHIPKSAIPCLKKVFKNMSSLEIKFCVSQPYQCYRWNTVWEGSELRCYSAHGLIASERGLLTTSNGAAFSYGTNRDARAPDKIDVLKRFYKDFDSCMVNNWPERMTKLVMKTAKIQELAPEGIVFMTKEQYPKLLDFISESRFNQSWLENPKNVVYWLKNPSVNEHSLRERIWTVFGVEFTRTDGEPNISRKIMSDERLRGVKELFGGSDDD